MVVELIPGTSRERRQKCGRYPRRSRDLSRKGAKSAGGTPEEAGTSRGKAPKVREVAPKKQEPLAERRQKCGRWPSGIGATPPVEASRAAGGTRPRLRWVARRALLAAADRLPAREGLRGYAARGLRERSGGRTQESGCKGAPGEVGRENAGVGLRGGSGRYREWERREWERERHAARRQDW